MQKILEPDLSAHAIGSFLDNGHSDLSIDDVRARLEALLEGAGSQKALAADLRVSPPYISQILNGERRPTRIVLNALGLRENKTVTYTYREKR